ncbi:MAG: hypothetical protein H6850_00965 [Alphaproteobacteria bacterium]|nr:MAG: hypothetical protein H6850_00965 [Alphaproteobacteria bacterium]
MFFLFSSTPDQGKIGSNVMHVETVFHEFCVIAPDAPFYLKWGQNENPKEQKLSPLTLSFLASTLIPVSDVVHSTIDPKSLFTNVIMATSITLMVCAHNYIFSHPICTTDTLLSILIHFSTLKFSVSMLSAFALIYPLYNSTPHHANLMLDTYNQEGDKSKTHAYKLNVASTDHIQAPDSKTIRITTFAAFNYSDRPQEVYNFLNAHGLSNPLTIAITKWFLQKMGYATMREKYEACAGEGGIAIITAGNEANKNFLTVAPDSAVAEDKRSIAKDSVYGKHVIIIGPWYDHLGVSLTKRESIDHNIQFVRCPSFIYFEGQPENGTSPAAARAAKFITLLIEAYIEKFPTKSRSQIIDDCIAITMKRARNNDNCGLELPNAKTGESFSQLIDAYFSS